tara:strand:- start:827 stop:1540 length:714 start_codon:yes stop_codon:yes gene_type:complete
MKSMGFADDRAVMIGIMQEIGAVVALIVYAVSEAIAKILRFIVTLAGTVVDVVLGPNLSRLVWAVGQLQELDEKGAGNYTRDAIGVSSPSARDFVAAQGGMYNTISPVATVNIPGTNYAYNTADIAYGTGGDGYFGTKYSVGGAYDSIMGYANGGMIKGYANGGPIVVGERGPELFVPPRMGGQVLNTDRTRNLLRGQNGTSNGNGMINTLIVQNLTAANSTSNNSKIAVDTFAGVV